MNELKELSAITALNAMMQKGWMDITAIDTIGTMLGINPKCEAYNILRPLHCVHFDKMPPQLRDAIPGLVKQCLFVEPTYQFEAAPTIQPTQPKAAERPARGFLRLLSSSD